MTVNKRRGRMGWRGWFKVRPVVLLGFVRGHNAVAGLHVGHLLLEAHVLRGTILNLVVLGELGAE